MKFALIFVVAALVSFAGSLQLGPVNLTVIQQVLQRHLRAGVWVALGGCLPEMLYATAAVKAGQWLENHRDIWQFIEWGSVPLLLLIGIVTYRATPKNSTPSPTLPLSGEGSETQRISKVATKSSSTIPSPFWRGMMMGMLNPQLFPFWLLVLVQFNSYAALRVQSPVEQGAFVVGTSVGALGLLVGVAFLTAHYKETLLQKLQAVPFHRVLGVIFCGFAVIQCVKLLIDRP
ncbi:MAG: LysE family transporter [Spirosomaceae bacterium]|nr:LysE family transporter [Spirosomataceae bacterium]